MMSDDVNSADIFSFHVVAYHCIIVESNKSDAKIHLKILFE